MKNHVLETSNPVIFLFNAQSTWYEIQHAAMGGFLTGEKGIPAEGRSHQGRWAGHSIWGHCPKTTAAGPLWYCRTELPPCNLSAKETQGRKHISFHGQPNAPKKHGALLLFISTHSQDSFMFLLFFFFFYLHFNRDQAQVNIFKAQVRHKFENNAVMLESLCCCYVSFRPKRLISSTSPDL